jgi:YARHG domain-containing protein
MRNEIFARYGYIFRPGGKMEKYFQSQSWYQPNAADVNSFLTEIELQNIETIRKLENAATDK